jgi:hypothetical protein
MTVDGIVFYIPSGATIKQLLEEVLRRQIYGRDKRKIKSVRSDVMNEILPVEFQRAFCTRLGVMKQPLPQN